MYTHTKQKAYSCHYTVTPTQSDWMSAHYTGIVSHYRQILFGGGTSATQKDLACIIGRLFWHLHVVYTYVNFNYLSEIFPV